MAKKKTVKTVRAPKFTPITRICDNPACMKTFTAKREKQRFHAPKCKQAVFSGEKQKKAIADTVKEFTEQLRRVTAAAVRLLDAMEICHICSGNVLLQDSPVHCIDCSSECENHTQPECRTIAFLHTALRLQVGQVNIQRLILDDHKISDAVFQFKEELNAKLDKVLNHEREAVVEGQPPKCSKCPHPETHWIHFNPEGHTFTPSLAETPRPEMGKATTEEIDLVDKLTALLSTADKVKILRKYRAAASGTESAPEQIKLVLENKALLDDQKLTRIAHIVSQPSSLTPPNALREALQGLLGLINKLPYPVESNGEIYAAEKALKLQSSSLTQAGPEKGIRTAQSVENLRTEIEAKRAAISEK